MPSLHDRLQGSLGTAYTIERELGGGGMSRVFLALERALGRQVVVKVLEANLGEELSLDRFAREIRTAATLQQANIVPLLSAGAMDGVPYYTMPFVEGDSLRARMNTGPVTPAEAVGILRDMARALAYAHARGVVHRDIKPENVLLSGGAAVITDFGIAKAVTVSATHPDADARATLTRLGTQIGTPAYMAPEQAAGDPDIDHRADLYSFGVLAYELLAGRHPFAEKRTAQELIVAHMVQAPEPLATRASIASGALARLVDQCLAKDPAERPASATDVIAALDAIRLSGDASADALGASPAPATHAVAVLPFANVSSDPENEYLSDGITDEVIGTLGRMRVVRVAGRASCFALKGKQLTPREVGRQLNVTAVVEGSIRRVGDRVRVSAELVNVVDGFQLWSERYDRDLTDIFAVQEEIALAIATALVDRLTVRVQATNPAPAPGNGEAYRLYLQCMHMLRNQFTPASYQHALEIADRATTLDPTLARAHLAKAITYNNLWVFSFRRGHDVCPLARAAVNEALSLDPGLAEAWSIEAQQRYAYDFDWSGARASFERGLACDPSDPGILARASLFFALYGDEARSVDLARRVAEVDPLSAWTRFVAGTAFRLLRRVGEADEALSGALELNPHHLQAIVSMAALHLMRGDREAAADVYRRALVIGGETPIAMSGLCATLGLLGLEDEAQSLLDRLVAHYERTGVGGIWVASALAWLGRVDEGVEWLERAFEGREFWITWLLIDAHFDVFRGHPGFQALLARVDPAAQ